MDNFIKFLCVVVLLAVLAVGGYHVYNKFVEPVLPSNETPIEQPVDNDELDVEDNDNEIDVDITAPEPLELL